MVKVSLLFLVSLLNEKFKHKDPVSKHHWAYDGDDGPSYWPAHYEVCGGLHQSPINIGEDAVQYDPNLQQMELHNFESLSQISGHTIMNISNNGHAASCRIKGDFFITGGGLAGPYRSAEFHFHWGSDNVRGSEHSLYGRKFPLEMHVVSFAEKYGNLSRAMNEPDGLAVMGVFFEISEHDNPKMEAVVAALSKIVHFGNHQVIQNCALRSLLPKDLKAFYRYQGSLTTPPCYESVIWTVFAETQYISEKQLDALRNLEEHDHLEIHSGRKRIVNRKMVNNYRPVQPINRRRLTKSFQGKFLKKPVAMFPVAPSLEVKTDSYVPETSTSASETLDIESMKFPTAGESSSVDSGSNFNEKLKNSGSILSRIRDSQKQGVLISEANSKLSHPPSSIQSADTKSAALMKKQTLVEQQHEYVLPSAGKMEAHMMKEVATTTTNPVFPYVTLISGSFLQNLLLGNRRQVPYSRQGSMYPTANRPVVKPVADRSPYSVPNSRTMLTSGAAERPSFHPYQSVDAKRPQSHAASYSASRNWYPPTTRRPPIWRQQLHRYPKPVHTRRQYRPVSRQPGYRNYYPWYNYRYRQRFQRPLSLNTPPPVYLQPASRPMRIRKPYFYRYHLKRYGPTAPKRNLPGGSVTVTRTNLGGLGEMR